MTENDDAQHNRITNPHHSYGAKKGWLRHRPNYMRGIRKRERNKMNKTNNTFYSIAQDLEEVLQQIPEAKLGKNDVFDLTCDIILDNIAGGLSFTIDKDAGTVSFSTKLTDVGGQGNYKLLNIPTEEDAYKALYEDIKDELQTIAVSIDEGIKQILAQHGLSET